MGALLVLDWLADAVSQAVVDEASVSQLREEVRRVAAGRLDATTTEQLVTAASELGMNQLVHAGGGRAAVLPIERAGVAGVEVIAADAGPGIATPTAALRGEVGASTKGLGAGLSAVLRLCQEVDFDVRQGEGTCVWARSFASALPRSEVAILGRPHPHERVSGDHAAFARLGGRLVVAVSDGLGHGPAARDASDRAARLVRQDARLAPAELLRRCDEALRATRGAAMSVFELDLEAAPPSALHAGAGNVAAHLYKGRLATRFGSVARVIGGRPHSAPLREERAALEPTDVLVMFSDGVSTRLDLATEGHLRLQPPLLIADRLMEHYGQHTDDALILVARHG